MLTGDNSIASLTNKYTVDTVVLPAEAVTGNWWKRDHPVATIVAGKAKVLGAETWLEGWRLYMELIWHKSEYWCWAQV